MSHPRVEEVSDSDPDAVSDPDEGDIDFVDSDIIRRVSPAPRPTTTTTSSSSNPAAHILNPSLFPPLNAAAPPDNTRTITDTAAFRGMQTLYPVYFDAARSRVQGRRVKSTLAVVNPLARTIADACARLGLRTLLEPDKVHPLDWANPGRVKIGLKLQQQQRRSAGAAPGPVLNKHHLYILVAQYLRANPTTEKNAGLRLHMGGQVQPPDDVAYPRPAVPRGWKMGTLLPYRSAAMTGGGVSENLFQDMMRGMQGGGSDPLVALMAGQQPQQRAASPAAGSAGGKAKKKKDKKGKQKT